jgi:hypothetical protein
MSTSTTRDFIDRLPELPLEPFEVAGTLDRSDRGPFLTIRPHKSPAPKSPAPKRPTATPLAKSKSSYTIQKYWTQAIYPRVICCIPGDFLDGLEINVDPQPVPRRDRPPTDIAALAGQQRFYKLSSLKGVPFKDPLWCSVKYGPWLATAIETGSCFDFVPSQWEFFIVEMPEVSLVWSGNWGDMPAYPSLWVTMGDRVLAGPPQTIGCDGFKWCPTTQSWIPQGVNCQDSIPV